MVRTYNPKQVIVTINGSRVTGIADDTFINVEPNADGTTTVVGCDGEINRAINVDQTYKVTLTLLQNSPWDKTLYDIWTKDQNEGTGFFPLNVKDIMGHELFNAPTCWVEKPANWQRGKDINKREWALHTGAAKFEGDGRDETYYNDDAVI